jgi:hypothetical protein
MREEKSWINSILIMFLLKIILSFFFIYSSALRHIPKLNTPKSNAPTTSINHVHSIKPFLSTAVLFPLLPSVCHAADGSNQNAFLVPLAISIFTMVPFLYYQQ